METDQVGDKPPQRGPEDLDLPADRERRLRDQVAQLETAKTSHAAIDQAIGILMAIGGVTPDEGWDILREVSMNTNIRVRDVAELIRTGAQHRTLDPRIREPLNARLGVRARCRHSG